MGRRWKRGEVEVRRVNEAPPLTLRERGGAIIRGATRVLKGGGAVARVCREWPGVQGVASGEKGQGHGWEQRGGVLGAHERGENERKRGEGSRARAAERSPEVSF